MRDNRSECGLPKSGRAVQKQVIGRIVFATRHTSFAGVLVGSLLGFGLGGTALLATLCASASYIAVPAAMRLALPQARPGIYVTLSLGVTFPFNLTLGIPAYVAVAQALTGA